MIKKVFIISILMGVLIFINSCKDEETYEPLELTYTKKDLTSYASENGEIQVNVNGGKKPYAYLWNNGETSPKIENLVAGNYSITVTDDQSKTITEVIELTQPELTEINITYTSLEPSYFSASDGSIDISISGGAPPYSFMWSNNDTTEDLYNIPAGEYTLTVTDNVEQTKSETITLNEPDEEQLYIEYTTQDVSVFGAEDGSIDVTIYGGIPPYTFEWSNGLNTEDLFNITAGTYELTVTDNQSNTAQESFTINQPNERITFTDIDGNSYEAIRFGNYFWMTENLKVTKSPDGEDIESLLYDNDEANLEPYGRLYDWFTANEVCPEGWHLPTKTEWQILVAELGGANVAGGKMKETGTTYWNAPNTGATNESGLSIRAAGEKDEVQFRLLGEYAVYWTSTSVNSVDASEVYLSYDNAKVTYFDWHKVLYYSVRCVKQAESS